MKIVFFGSSNFALPVLEELNTHHQVLAVVTTPDAPVGRSQVLTETPVSALAKDIKLPIFKPVTLKNNQEFADELKKLNADVFIVVSYGMFLSDDFINMPQLKAVNVHPSPLPRYRGPTPIQTALKNGDEQTGTSIMLLDSEMDHGPLLAQKIINIDPDDNYFTLTDKLAKLSAHLLLDTLEDYRKGSVTPLPQDHVAATHTKIITKQDGKVDWQKSATEIYNQFRAFYIWPGIWTEWNGKKIKILDCTPVESSDSADVGQVLDGGIVVCDQGTYFKIRSLQPEGKSEMGIADFLNGNKTFVGSKLG